MLEDVPELDAVVVGVGGGGLVSGIAVTALDGRARVIAVEPELSPALHGGPRRRPRVPRRRPHTIADGLAPPFAGELPLELCRGRVESVLVTEDEIARGDALPLRAREARLRAGAAPRRPARARGQGRRRAGGVAVVVSGGNVEPQQAAAILSGQ